MTGEPEERKEASLVVRAEGGSEVGGWDGKCLHKGNDI